MLNRPAELWRMLHLVAPDQWPDFEQFRSRYCQRGEDGLIDGLVTGHGMVERVTELRCLIDELMLRRSKADLLHKLPPKVRRSVVCDLEPQDRAHYDAASKNVVKWLRSIGSEMARTAVGNEALVRFTMLRHIAARGKLRKAVGVFLRQWFSEKRRPLVVFGFHRDVIAGVRAICARIGVRTACILGEYSGERRQAELDSFQCGNADVFVAPLRAAGVGLNLQRASDALVLERLWTPSLGEQAEDRLHRLGQTRQVTIWYLDARDTIDQHIAEIQRDKHKLIGRVVDDVSAEQQRAEEQQTIEQLAQLLSTKG
jgi:SNF2 family DNA or RNA helicase